MSDISRTPLLHAGRSQARTVPITLQMALSMLGYVALQYGGKFAMPVGELAKIDGDVSVITDANDGTVSVVYTPAHQLPKLVS